MKNDSEGYPPKYVCGPSYSILTTGRLSLDKYKGDITRSRASCTSVLISAGNTKIIVDPGWDDEEIVQSLSKRGVRPDEIDIVFLTHSHADHVRAITLFSRAKWMISHEEFVHWQRHKQPGDEEILVRLRSHHGGLLAEGVRTVLMPGHTPGLSIIVFVNGGKIIAVTGDGVMTREYFEHNEPFPNSTDPGAAVQSIKQIRMLADFIVPGHSDPFYTAP